MKKQKKITILTLIGILCSLLSVYAAENKIPVKGEWSEQGVRSLVSVPPTASLDENVVFIEFTSALSDLTITIAGTNGFYYQETISSGPNSSYQVPQTLPEGEYTLYLTHSYGTLTGVFEVE